MKFFLHKDRIVATDYSIDNFPPKTLLVATPTLPTEVFYGSVSGLEEVQYEDVKYLQFHLKKELKNILPNQN